MGGLLSRCFRSKRESRADRREAMRAKYRKVSEQAFDEASFCFKCQVQFSMFTRRHHCRRCRHSFCNKHSAWHMKVSDETDAEEVRVCERCHQATEMAKSTGMSWGLSYGT